MSKIEIIVPLNDYTGMNNLIKSLPEIIIQELNKKGEEIEYHDPNGNDIEIKILASIGKEWADKEIHIEVNYTGKSKN